MSQAFKALLLSLLLLFSCSAKKEPKAPDYPRYAKSVAAIYTIATDQPEASNNWATAFAIDSKHLLTAGHFCETAVNKMEAGEVFEHLVLVTILGGEQNQHPMKFYILDWNHEIDTCILRSEGLHGLKPLELAPSLDYLQIEDRVLTVGYPGGYGPARYYGYVMAKRAGVWEEYNDNDLRNLLYLTMQSEPGSSGSALIDVKTGKVIGLVVRSPKRPIHSTMATKSTDILLWLNTLDLEK